MHCIPIVRDAIPRYWPAGTWWLILGQRAGNFANCAHPATIPSYGKCKRTPLSLLVLMLPQNAGFLVVKSTDRLVEVGDDTAANDERA